MPSIYPPLPHKYIPLQPDKMSHLNLAQPLTLACGLTLPNRLVKAAMAEGLANEDLLPGSKDCLNIYGEWAKGGWGLVISGTTIVFLAFRKILNTCRKRSNRR
jgi:2,4-dienoyl-CoA reductase-like NADH-dependent reductase (Old Yellow Enzyme family)